MADLIDRDALEPFYESGTDPDDSYADMIYIRAEHIENAPAVNRWIPCSERLPEQEKEVIVYVKGDFENSIPFITTAYINSDCDWQSDYDGEVIDSKITHWMPLPEPPKE